MPVRSKVRNDRQQLELFALTLPAYDSVDSIWTHGREALAGVPAKDGGRAGSEGKAPRDATGGGGEDRGGDGPDSAAVDSTGLDAAAGARLSLGDRAREIHLPPAGKLEFQQEALVSEPEPLRNQRNYRITDDDKLGIGSLKQKCGNNLAAIELLLACEAEGLSLPTEEKPVLVRYVGWGGLPQVFDERNKEWNTERERLEALLTADELGSARASTLNAHYTSPTVIRAMYSRAVDKEPGWNLAVRGLGGFFWRVRQFRDALTPCQFIF